MIEFTLPYPKTQKQKASFCRQYGLNSIYAGKHWAQRKSDKDYWKWLVMSELRNQGIPAVCVQRPVEITFRWDDGLDCSNHAYMAKMIEDAIKGYIIKDDSRKYVKRIVHDFSDDGIISVKIQEV